MSRKWNDEEDEGQEYARHDGKRRSRQSRSLLKQARGSSFHCAHCGAEVPTEAAQTQHRNHCPICLWSLHVDDSIGDRKSTCLSVMEPLGLTIKRDGGELMLVHRCRGCGKISKNRIAGDDNAATIEDLFESSAKLDASMLALLAAQGIQVCLDRELIWERLWGRQGTS